MTADEREAVEAMPDEVPSPRNPHPHKRSFLEVDTGRSATVTSDWTRHAVLNSVGDRQGHKTVLLEESAPPDAGLHESRPQLFRSDARTGGANEERAGVCPFLKTVRLPARPGQQEPHQPTAAASCPSAAQQGATGAQRELREPK